jgi:hypothetical protein
MKLELKWYEKSETAISQIKEKKYIKALDGYQGGSCFGGNQL